MVRFERLSVASRFATGLTAAFMLLFPLAGKGESDESASKEEQEPAPIISRIEPVTGSTAGGETVLIYGANFREDSKVFFGGHPTDAKDVKVSHQGALLTIEKTPSGKGEVKVRIQNPDGSESKEQASFFYGGGLGSSIFKVKYGLRLFWFWFDAGGWVMWPILALSIIGLALIFHCMFALREMQVFPTSLVEDVAEYLVNGKMENAAEYCRKKDCIFGRIVLAGIQKSNQSAEIIRDSMGAAGTREADHLYQKINYMSNIGTIAPMLGLFGTVWGLQLAFMEISGHGAQHQVLAGAIAVALNTTIAGLIVGVGCFVGYFWFRGKIVQLVAQMEVLTEEMAEKIIQRKGESE